MSEFLENYPKHVVFGFRPYTPQHATKRKLKPIFLRHKVFYTPSTRAKLFLETDIALSLLSSRDGDHDLHWTPYFAGNWPFDWEGQDLLVFDLDDAWGVLDDLTREEKLARAQVLADVLDIPFANMAVVDSGHGLHVYIKMARTVQNPDFFAHNRGWYKEICRRVDERLKEVGFKGRMDPAVFCKGHLMRMPGSLNWKYSHSDDAYTGDKIRSEVLKWPGKAERMQDLPPSHIKGLVIEPFLQKGERGRPLNNILHDTLNPGPKATHPPIDDLKNDYGPALAEGLAPDPSLYANVDEDAVLSGCTFLQECHERPNDVTEPQWYHMLGILSFLPSGERLVHDYSRGYEKYNFAETAEKARRAKESAGPRLCKTIESVSDACEFCPHRNKVVSPVFIKGEDFIATEGTGFRILPVSGEGVGKIVYEDLLKAYQRDVTFCLVDYGNSSRPGFFEYNGVFWEPGDINRDPAKYCYNKVFPKPNNNQRKEFVALVNLTTPKQGNWFERAHDGFINLQNGVLDIKNRVLLPHSPDFGFRGVLPYSYDPFAECPNFDQFLKNVTLNREDLAQLLLEYAGYAIAGGFSFLAKAMFLTGSGANGKSTFIRVLQELVGPSLYSVLPLESFGDAVALSCLEHVHFNVSNEASTRSLVHNETFKSVVSGDEITVRQLYVGARSMRSNAKLLVSLNTLPKLKEIDGGLSRRLIFVPFDADFTDNPDYGLFDRLMGELPGIFNRVMDGYDALMERGRLIESESAADIKTLFLQSNDMFSEWLRENVQVTGEKTDFVPSKVLYGNYLEECEDAGIPRHEVLKRGDLFQRMKRKYKQGLDIAARDVFQGQKVRSIRGLKVVSGSQYF